MANKTLILLSAAATALLLFSTFSGVAKPSENIIVVRPMSHEEVLRSSCGSAPHYDLCVSVAAATGRELTSQKDVVMALLDATAKAARRNFLAAKGVAAKRRGSLTTSGRTEAAVRDCLETIELSIEDLEAAMESLESYPKEKTLRRHADDLNILISSAMTYQETCLDGLSLDGADTMVHRMFSDRLMHVERLCSIALAMIKNMTETDIANSELNGKAFTTAKLIKGVVETAAEVVGDGWPRWMSAKDRWFLESPYVKPDLVVATDGSGDFATVAEAVEAAPNKSDERFVIKINAGVYYENYEVPKKKRNLVLIGDGRLKTIITGNLSVGGTFNMTTFKSATFAVKGEGFLARDITFENTAGPSNDQAVALRVDADFSAFYRCGVSAYQDTLYLHSKRTFFVHCNIAGSVDFIFGNAAAVLQKCVIHPRRPNPQQKNMVTAQNRIDPNQNTGIVIQNCQITATSDLLPVIDEFPSYLGRPWKNFSRTVVMQSYISRVIDPQGWYPWDGTKYLTTLTYREFQNRGPGANTTLRVDWEGFKVISNPLEAIPYIPARFIDGASWIPNTGFPYELGLYDF